MRHHQVLGTLLAIAFLMSACEKKETAAPAKGSEAVPVKFQSVGSSTIINSSDFVGTLQASKRVQLAPQIQGRILEINVSEGAKVLQGSLVVQLQPIKEQENVNAASANVNVQKAGLDSSVADLVAAQQQEQRAVAEVAVRVAEVAGAEADIKNRRAQLQSQKAELELAKINYDRTKFLVDTGALAKQNLDDATRDLETTRSNTEAARESLDAAVAAKKANEATVVQARKAVQAAQAQVSASKAAVQGQKAAIAQAQSQLGSVSQDLVYNRVVAPIDGIVGDIPVKVGDFVNVGQQLTTIIQNDTMDLYVNIPVERTNQVEIGLPVELIKSDGTVGVTGAISFISPNVDQQAQTISTKITFVNDGNLRDSQFVKVRVIWQKKSGVLVPTSAINQIGGQAFAFVVENAPNSEGKAGKIARQKTVVLGDIQGQNYQVVSGINPGDTLVVSGIQKLRDKTPVVETEAVKSQTN